MTIVILSPVLHQVITVTTQELGGISECSYVLDCCKGNRHVTLIALPMYLIIETPKYPCIFISYIVMFNTCII